MRARILISIQGDQCAGVLEIEPHHIVEFDTAASANLPEPGDARFGFEQAAAMPDIVSLDFVGDRRPRADQRHFALQHIKELWNLVQAGLAQERSDGCDSRILGQLVDTLASAVGVLCRFAGDQLLHVFPVHSRRRC